MNIEIKDIITLNGNMEYVIASKTIYQGVIYFYAANIEAGEIKFLREKDKNILTEVSDKNLCNTLLPLFFESAKDLYDLPLQ